MREKVSACIITGNEEENIRRCLESVKWADEIVVVDSYSTDKTFEISTQYTNRVYRHEWLGYIAQKNLIKDMASHPWILFVDADEEVSEKLKTAIVHELESGECKEYSGYDFPRMVKYLGRWIVNGDWYPDVKLRMFRKDRGRCVGREPHDRVEVEGKVKRLNGCLYHYTYENIEDQVAAINGFSTITARGWHEENRVFHMEQILFRPIFKFVRSYFFRRGFMDGMPGLIIAVTTAFGVFVKYAKLWETRYVSEVAKDKADSIVGKPPPAEPMDRA